MSEDEQHDLPDWRVRYPAPHDWRNYVSEELQEHWTSFTLVQRRMIGRNAQEIADREEWE